jgi:hypothetical protein
MISSSHASTTSSSVVLSSGTVQYTRGEAKILNCLYSSVDFTDSEISYIISNYDVIIINWYNYAPQKDSIVKLKQQKPSLVILVYISAFSASPNEQFYGLPWSEVTTHEDWFLHDVDGNRLQISWESGWYGMDITNAGWQKNLGDWCSEVIQKCPEIDGIFCDNAWEEFYLDLWTVPSTKIPTGYGATWHADMTSFLAYLKGRIGTKLLIPNTHDTADYVDVSDGEMAEDFIHYSWWDVNYFGTFNYPERIANFKSVLDRGKYFLAIDGALNIQTLEDAQHVFYYSFCSFLLIANEKASFEFTTWDYLGNNAFGLLELTKNAEPLGPATGDYYSLTNCLARNFENGRVIVNYTPYSTTIDLGGNFRTLDGAVLNQTTLLPHTGVILYKV